MNHRKKIQKFLGENMTLWRPRWESILRMNFRLVCDYMDSGNGWNTCGVLVNIGFYSRRMQYILLQLHWHDIWIICEWIKFHCIFHGCARIRIKIITKAKKKTTWIIFNKSVIVHWIYQNMQYYYVWPPIHYIENASVPIF